MRPVIIIGAGGHARSVASSLQHQGRSVTGYVDPDPARIGEMMNGVEIRGSDEWLLDQGPDAFELTNGIGTKFDHTGDRQRVYEKFVGAGFQFCVSVDHRANVSEDVELSDGCQILASATVQTGTRIGANVIVNSASCIDHDCRIGDHVHIAPGVVLCGGVTIGAGSQIGAGAIVLPGCSLAANCIVGAGATIAAGVAAGQTVVGTPARPIENTGR